MQLTLFNIIILYIINQIEVCSKFHLIFIKMFVH